MRESCGNCRYFMVVENDRTQDFCRRYPPDQFLIDQPASPLVGGAPGGKSVITRWPIVNAIQWCGEWEAADGYGGESALKSEPLGEEPDQ